MSFQLTCHDILGVPQTFALSTPGELLITANTRRRHGEQVLAFVADDRAARQLLALIAASAAGIDLKVAALTNDLDADERNDLMTAGPDRVDVLVTTDAFNHGWRAPDTMSTVMHLGLPQVVTSDLVAKLAQREARRPLTVPS